MYIILIEIGVDKDVGIAEDIMDSYVWKIIKVI